MDNHIHLIVIPRRLDSLEMGIGRTAYSYCRWYNENHPHEGTIWNGRFFSSPLDTREYLHTALVYVETNPIRAGICPTAADFDWSSARIHTTPNAHPGILMSATIPGHTPQEWELALARKEDADMIQQYLLKRRRDHKYATQSPAISTA